MDYKLYKTPDPQRRTDTSMPYGKSIADLLLTFDNTPNLKEGVRKIVTVPAQNEIGFNVVACQAFFRGLGPAAYVFLHDQESLYQFRQAVPPRKSGSRGLLLDTEKIRVVENKFNSRTREERDEYETELKRLVVHDTPADDWYHFTGTTQKLLAELQQKYASIRR
ncbi:MAG: hypothetical protein Q8R47_05355 [Nanoarchaeota archaeon]|nr:hypothetical protein [Nanoarchaeota archaeon]